MDEQSNNTIVLTIGFWGRLRGLLFVEPHKRWHILSPCRGIHTIGMRYAIDVAFIDREGLVLESLRRVEPMKTLRNRRAVAVVERFESRESWLNEGDRLSLRIQSPKGCQEKELLSEGESYEDMSSL